MAQRNDVREVGAVSRPGDDRKSQLLARLASADREVIEPEPVDADRYREVNEAFVDAVLPHPSVRAIYGESKTPTVPGISDADFTVVVDDDLQDVAELEAAVSGVFEQFPRICTHGAGVLSASVAEYYPLFDCFTLALEHLAGEPIAPVVEETPLTNEMIMFDNLASRAYGFLLECILPQPSVPGRDLPPVSLGVDFLNPIVSVARGIPALTPDRVVLDKRGGLHAMSSPKHDLYRFERALGRKPAASCDAVDRAREFRTTYFETDPPDDQYVELFVELAEFKFELLGEAADEQSVYDASHDTFLLRRGRPTLGTPAFHDLSVYDVVDLCLDSATSGVVLPPAAVCHLATLPHGDELFYGTPPEPRIRRAEAARLVDRRREVFEELLAFKYESGIADAMPEPFCFPHVVGLVDDNADVGRRGTGGPATAVKHRFRDLRNWAVLRAWDRRLSRRRDDRRVVRRPTK